MKRWQGGDGRTHGILSGTVFPTSYLATHIGNWALGRLSEGGLCDRPVSSGVRAAPKGIAARCGPSTPFPSHTRCLLRSRVSCNDQSRPGCGIRLMPLRCLTNRPGTSSSPPGSPGSFQIALKYTFHAVPSSMWLRKAHEPCVCRTKCLKHRSGSRSWAIAGLATA
jgi:hypothetical protein